MLRHRRHRSSPTPRLWHRAALGLLSAILAPALSRAQTLTDDPSTLSDPAAATAPSPLPKELPPLEVPVPDDGRFDDAISRLGAADATQRDEASRALWKAGKAAQPALERALDDPDPEVARRAKEILRNFRFGLLPNTPKEIVDLLEQYRVGQPQDRRTAIDSLAIKGAAGTRLLLKLWQEETDDGMRRVLLHALTMRAPDTSMMLASEGDWDLAEQLLKAAASTGADRVLRDYASFLLTRGTLKEAIAKVQERGAPTDGADPVAASRRWLTYLHRANGDVAAARLAAERSGDEKLIDGVLIEQSDWKALAARADARAANAGTVEQIGFAAAYQRLSGNPSGEQTWIDRLANDATHPETARQPGDSWNVAKELFLSGRPDPATAILLKTQDYAAAIDFNRLRLKFDEALTTADEAKREHSAELPQIEISTATLQHYLGQTKLAEQTLNRIAESAVKLRNPALSEALVQAAATMRLKDRTADYLATALAQLGPNEPTASLFEDAGYENPARASQWWKYLRRRHKEGTKIILGRLRLIVSGAMSASELEGNARLAEQDAALIRPDERAALLEAVAETLLEQGRDQAAYRVFERLGLGGQPAYLIRIGDIEAGRKRFSEAAALYGRAWEMNRAVPLPIFLKGWAMTQIQREKYVSASVSMIDAFSGSSVTARFA